MKQFLLSFIVFTIFLGCAKSPHFERISVKEPPQKVAFYEHLSQTLSAEELAKMVANAKNIHRKTNIYWTANGAIAEKNQAIMSYVFSNEFTSLSNSQQSQLMEQFRINSLNILCATKSERAMLKRGLIEIYNFEYENKMPAFSFALSDEICNKSGI